MSLADTAESPSKLKKQNDDAVPVAHGTRNLAALAVHHVVLRVAWIFKTESVIMPAFMDAIAGAGWLRGCLPILNRIGQSVPPMVSSSYLRSAPRKRTWLMLTCFGMAAPFLILSAVTRATGSARFVWMPYLFLLLYVIFFSMTGLNALSFGTLQGKLIAAERRGRLMAIAGVVGSVCAITMAWFLLRTWLTDPETGFAKIFAFTGTGFLLAGLCALAVKEPADNFSRSGVWYTPFVSAKRSLERDQNLRRLAIVAMLFVTAQLLFPHYQALGRLRPGWTAGVLMYWVIAQNAGAGLFSFLAGPIADRYGNRLTLRLLILCAALTPLIALSLADRASRGTDLYWLTFVSLGTVPTTFKVLINYTLELTDREHHPHYISTLKLCMAFPLLLSPFVGALIEPLGFSRVFISVGAIGLVGAAMTFFMVEPRQALR